MRQETIATNLIDLDGKNRATGEIPPLAASIRAQGLLQPILVKERGNGRFLLIAGHRRLAAVALLGWEQVDCRVADPESDAALCRVAENVGRKDLQPWELCEAVSDLHEKGHSIKDIAAALCQSESHTYALKRVRDLLRADAWELFKSQGRKAKISEWLALASRSHAEQGAALFGETATPPTTRKERRGVSKATVNAKLRLLPGSDPRVKMLKWFLGEIRWAETE